ncbi:MAG: amino acid permease [Selenomonas sp.]|nr:amino acid permease [Selenomonas sp.]
MVKSKFGFWSIVLLGINAIIGSGIFLLPNQAYALSGAFSLVVVLFDAVLAMSLALCFAEASGRFHRNGGPYIYARAAFGNFIGFEVGFMKAAISIIAWAAMANGFATALSAVVPALNDPFYKNAIIILLMGSLGLINVLGVQVSKIINNIVTVGKLLPLLLFIAVGLFYVNAGNFTPMLPTGAAAETFSFGAAALLIFYAFTGFEAIAEAAEDMENPQRNIPRAIMVVMGLVSLFYFLILAISIGVLGPDLANTKTPIATAAAVFLGSAGGFLVTAGTLVSIGGINLASSFLTPRVIVAIADDHMLPPVFSRYSRFGTPYVAILFATVVGILIALSGSFTTLAAISVVSRFAQYVPTCLAILVLRRKDPEHPSTLSVPWGPVIPVVAILVSLWLLVQADAQKILIGLGGLIIAMPFYFIMKKQYLQQGAQRD